MSTAVVAALVDEGDLQPATPIPVELEIPDASPVALERGARLDADIAHDMERVFETFPRLKERRKQLAGTMSGGEQQMLAIGRALMTNPHLLVLDEATEGLAPLVREDIWRCLHALRAEGQSILVIDKYVQKLVQLANQHTIIERGRVVWLGESSALEADRDLWQRYIGV